MNNNIGFYDFWDWYKELGLEGDGGISGTARVLMKKAWEDAGNIKEKRIEELEIKLKMSDDRNRCLAITCRRLERELEKAKEHIFECCEEDGCDCGYKGNIPDDTMQATMLPTMQALEAAIAYCEREITDDPAMLDPDTEIGHLYPLLKIAAGK